MISTIRPVFEYQYGNMNNTAADTLQFLDDYFNNTNGVHMATPQPVNYFLYAAGGGWYNSVNSSTGLGETTIPNNSFELPALAAATSQADPSGVSWTFAGTAGVVSNNTKYYRRRHRHHRGGQLAHAHQQRHLRRRRWATASPSALRIFTSINWAAGSSAAMLNRTRCSSRIPAAMS